MSLPKREENFPAWYQEVVRGAELAENSLAKGSMVIRPYGYAIWEAMVAGLDRRIKQTGHENLYFPLLIPYSLLEKEKEHVEGFSPQVAVVTHAGGAKLEEPLMIRPTSETIIWEHYKRWIQSHRDLPLLYNQWANVVRWEMRTRLFLRTTEFLWQEGHTAHATSEEAIAETFMVLKDVYRAAAEEDMAMPVLMGRKSASERFPGAQESYSIEALMGDGKALQAGTSHFFGQNFSRAYDVKFQAQDGSQQHPHSTSWGVSTRLIGGLIMCHGDDKGLRLPPKLAPVQVVIVPIYGAEERARVLEACEKIAATLPRTRVKIDDREHHRPGYKYNEWELKGVPVRLDVGARELDAKQVSVFRRDTLTKSAYPLDHLESAVPLLLEEIQVNLFDQAVARRAAATVEFADYSQMRDFLSQAQGFAVSGWCGDAGCEEKVKTDAKATIRALPIEHEDSEGNCIVCGVKATERATWAQSY